MSSQAAALVLMGALEKERLSPEEEAFYQKHAVGGVILFRRNVPEPYALLRTLTSQLQSLNTHYRHAPLIIAIDQEGGRVRRIWQDFPNPGAAMSLADGRIDREALAEIEAYGSRIGQELGQLGVNLNFAPVLDILTNPANDCIGDRAFGKEANSVSLRAGAFLRGMQSQDVYGCLKHFPGQGDAGVDTHVGSARINLSLEELEQREFAPFRQLLPSAKTVMISHSIYPALDQCEASLSSKVIRQLLRNKMGFDGLVVSDDMNMGAIPQEIPQWQEALVAAVVAGNDLLIIGRHIDRLRLAHEGLAREAQKSRAFSALLTEAAERVFALQRSLANARST